MIMYCFWRLKICCVEWPIKVRGEVCTLIGQLDQKKGKGVVKMFERIWMMGYLVFFGVTAIVFLALGIAGPNPDGKFVAYGFSLYMTICFFIYFLLDRWDREDHERNNHCRSWPKSARWYDPPCRFFLSKITSSARTWENTSWCNNVCRRPVCRQALSTGHRGRHDQGERRSVCTLPQCVSYRENDR